MYQVTQDHGGADLAPVISALKHASDQKEKVCPLFVMLLHRCTRLSNLNVKFTQVIKSQIVSDNLKHLQFVLLI